MSDFKKGDVVKLKSGGPAMTVTSVGSGSLTCEWFDKNEMPHAMSIAHEAVEPYKPQSF